MLHKNEIYYQGFSRGAAWRRFGARILDMWFYSFLSFLIYLSICFFTGLFGGDVAVQFIVSIGEFGDKYPKFEKIFWSFLTCSIMIPMSYHLFGNTVGKRLLGIFIVNKNGNSLNFKEASEREIQVFFKGLFFLWFSILYQYFSFRKNNILSWDKNLNLTVSYESFLGKNYGHFNIFIRSVVAVTTVLSLVFLHILLLNYLDAL